MFPELLDAFVLIIMVILRVGVPLALTLAFGYWLEKKLNPRAERQNGKIVQASRRITRSGKIIQVHCWDIKRCEHAKRAQCVAYQHPELPCWLALQAEGHAVREECFTCALYKPLKKAA